MLHRYCLQSPFLVQVFVVANLLIFAAYCFIPIQVCKFFRTSHLKFPHHHIFFWLGAFVALCGTTHLLHAWTMVYRPDYAVEGFLLVATAAVSLTTAVLLLPALVYFAGFKDIATHRLIAHDLRNQLVAVNLQLELMRDSNNQLVTRRLSIAAARIEVVLAGIEERAGGLS